MKSIDKHAPALAGRRALLALTLLASLDCATQGLPAARPADAALLARVRRDAEALLGDRTALEWQRWAHGIAVDASAALRRRYWLVQADTLDKLRGSVEDAEPGDERRALTYLYGFLLGEHVSQATAKIDDAAKRLQINATVDIDGAAVPYNQLPVLLANEPDAARRRTIAAASRPVMRDLNRILEERRRLEHTIARELGYADYVQLSSAVRHFDVAGAAALARRVLRGSEGLYQSALAALAPETLGIQANELRHADVPRLMKSAEFEAHFPPELLLETTRQAFLGLGIDTRKLPVHIDARDLPKKSPRAACFAVSVPADIRLSIKPVGGASDYVSLLHEMAHAVHLAHSRAVRFELQQLGDATVAEAFAFLIDGLMADPVWLAERTGIDEPALGELVRLGALKKLYMVRRYAAKVLYELELFRDPSGDGRRAYAEHLSRAYGFALDEVAAERYLLDADPFLYSAVYLRAWSLAAQMEERLRSQFGPRWWSVPEAGELLRAWWSEGQRLTGEELAASLGAGSLDAAPLLEQIAATLASSRPLARR